MLQTIYYLLKSLPNKGLGQASLNLIALPEFKIISKNGFAKNQYSYHDNSRKQVNDLKKPSTRKTFSFFGHFYTKNNLIH